MIPSSDLATMARRDGLITMANTVPTMSTSLHRLSLRDTGEAGVENEKFFNQDHGKECVVQ